VTRSIALAGVLVAFAALPASAAAFIGPYTGVGRGLLDRVRNVDNQAPDPADRIVATSKDRYQARFRYSFRIDGLGNIRGIGNGSYQTATWHLSGTNGSHGSFDCDVTMTTTEFAVRITGRAADGRMHVRFALEDAREANEETFCGANFYGFATDSTRLATSLELVQPPEGIVVDQADPAIAPITKTVPEGDATDFLVSDHEWKFTIEAPRTIPDVNSGVGAYGDPASAGRRAAICTVEGTAGAERLQGTPGSDVICAFGGNDTIDGGGGQDLIYGGPGDDAITGGKGLDALHGDAGRDRFKARDRKRDRLYGGRGRDRARVDRGRDRSRGVETLS
jgi:hypothetical protein